MHLLILKKLDPISPFYLGETTKLTIATQGYGNPYELNKLTYSLERAGITNLSIMVIGGNPYSLRTSQLISYYPPTYALKREEITSLMHHVDFLLILQKRDTRLVCSASPLEAISYGKPVLHYGDDCTLKIFDRFMIKSVKCDCMDDLVDSILRLSTISDYTKFYNSFSKSIVNVYR